MTSLSANGVGVASLTQPSLSGEVARLARSTRANTAHLACVSHGTVSAHLVSKRKDGLAILIAVCRAPSGFQHIGCVEPQFFAFQR